MEVNLRQLQESLMESYNDFITVLNDNNRDGTIELESYELKREAKDLLTAVKWILALNGPNEPDETDSLLTTAQLEVLK